MEALFFIVLAIGALILGIPLFFFGLIFWWLIPPILGAFAAGPIGFVFGVGLSAVMAVVVSVVKDTLSEVSSKSESVTSVQTTKLAPEVIKQASVENGIKYDPNDFIRKKKVTWSGRTKAAIFVWILLSVTSPSVIAAANEIHYHTSELFLPAADYQEKITLICIWVGILVFSFFLPKWADLRAQAPKAYIRNEEKSAS